MYSGVVASGERVAVKRAAKNSMQGAEEFKNEIELLSRVHHKNLVGLVGYCYDKGEQMLVYEFMNNGTILEWLGGKSYMSCPRYMYSYSKYKYTYSLVFHIRNTPEHD